MEHLQKTFASCKAEKRPALVTYVTAGYPTKEATVDILMGMGVCADIIELGRLSKVSPEYWNMLICLIGAPLHRPNRRWTYYSKGQYEGIVERSDHSVSASDGQKSSQAWIADSGCVHGLLQSNPKLWRGTTAQRCQRSRRERLHHCGPSS